MLFCTVVSHRLRTSVLFLFCHFTSYPSSFFCSGSVYSLCDSVRCHVGSTSVKIKSHRHIKNLLNRLIQVQRFCRISASQQAEHKYVTLKDSYTKYNNVYRRVCADSDQSMKKLTKPDTSLALASS